MKKLIVIIMALMVVATLGACTPADQVSDNLSKEADHFEILRKIVFYNGITDEYMFAMEGYCSIEADMNDEQLEVTCKIGAGQYEKHYLGLSDNVSYMVLQLETADVSEYHYKVYFRPQSLIPSIELDVE